MNASDDSGLMEERDLLLNENARQFSLHLPAITYTTILMLVGTPGNIVVMYVYFFKWRKSTSRMFILFLTGLDLVNCCTTLPMEIYLMRFSVMVDMPWVCKLSRFSTYTMNSSSAAILVAIAIDRYRRICRPHGPQFSARKSKYICIGCISVAVGISWPSLVFYGTRTLYVDTFQGKACLLQNNFDSSIYPYVFFVFQLASTCIIFLTLSVLYYFVGVQVYKHRKLRLERKAQSIAAKALIQNENSTNSQNNTLLQFSDSKELMKLQKQQLKLNDEQNQPEEEQEGEERTPDEEKEDVDEQHNPKDKEKHLKKHVEPEHYHKNQSDNQDNRDDEHNVNENDIEEHELNHVNRNHALVTGQATPIGGNSCSNISTAERVENCTDSSEHHLLNAKDKRSDKQKRSEKQRFSKKKGVLKDSLTKLNGSCMQMKLRIGRSTLMLFLITLAYIVSFVPFYVIAIIRQTDKNFVNNLSNVGYMIYHVFLRSYLLSSAINPVIYSFCNSQFRTFCLDMFRKSQSRRSHL